MRARFPLLTAFVGLGVLLCVVWRLADRETSHQRSSFVRETEAGEVELASLHLPEAAAVVAVQRTPLDDGAQAPEVEPARSTISGRLQIDGFAPYHGKVRLRQENGAWERTAAIDPYGRFYLEQVPAATLSLSFEAAGLEERKLLLPNAYQVTPAAGEIEFVDLDWKTRQLNVQVVSADAPPGQASVVLSGPHYRASFDTNARGKAKLNLIGSGRFSLRAERPGQSGAAELELEEGDELDTIVIATAPR